MKAGADARAEVLTVPQMAAEAGVSEDKVRTWCRAGLIEGAWNIGDGDREFWRAPRKGWDEFRIRRAPQRQRPVIVAPRKRTGRNLLGI